MRCASSQAKLSWVRSAWNRVCARRIYRSRPISGWRDLLPIARIRAAHKARERIASTGGLSRSALDELDLVAVRVFYERDDGGSMLHRTGFARNLAALRFYRFAGFVGVVHFERDMAISIAELIGFGIPVVRELEDGGIFLAAVADEGQREFAVREILLAQQLHAQHAGVEIERALQIAHSQ